MEGKTHYERIVGGTKEERKIGSQKLQDIFDGKSDRLSKYEIEKSPEDLEIIKKSEAFVDSMVLRYGSKVKPIPISHIYILKPGSVLAMTDNKLDGGIHQPMGLEIGIEKKESRLLFAGTLIHELLHLKSYKSARIGKNGEDVRLYRSGLSMIDRKNPDEEGGEEKEYFSILEEAIVAECTKKLFTEVSTDSTFSAEAQAIRSLRDWVGAYYRIEGVPEDTVKEFEEELKYISDAQDRVEEVLTYSDNEEARQAYAAGMFNALYKKGEVETFERYEERKKIYELLDKLVVGSEGKFTNRDEIFEKFATANFSGGYFSLARIVESILGEGSFRKLAEEFSEEPEKDE
jgi:hypothetical protein